MGWATRNPVLFVLVVLPWMACYVAAYIIVWLARLIWAILWALIWCLTVYPYGVIKRYRQGVHETRVKRAKDEMLEYQTDKENVTGSFDTRSDWRRW
jgi:hypothetical protein